MQLHIAINDALINEVLATSEFSSTEQAIEQALQLLLKTKRQEKAAARFADECRQQSLQLQGDAHEQDMQHWLVSVADCEDWT
jgi:hypothetical protein